MRRSAPRGGREVTIDEIRCRRDIGRASRQRSASLHDQPLIASTEPLDSRVDRSGSVVAYAATGRRGSPSSGCGHASARGCSQIGSCRGDCSGGCQASRGRYGNRSSTRSLPRYHSDGIRSPLVTESSPRVTRPARLSTESSRHCSCHRLAGEASSTWDLGWVLRLCRRAARRRTGGGVGPLRVGNRLGKNSGISRTLRCTRNSARAPRVGPRALVLGSAWQVWVRCRAPVARE